MKTLLAFGPLALSLVLVGASSAQPIKVGNGVVILPPVSTAPINGVNPLVDPIWNRPSVNVIDDGSQDPPTVVDQLPKPTLPFDIRAIETFDKLECVKVLGHLDCEIIFFCRDGWSPEQIAQRLGKYRVGLGGPHVSAAVVRRSLDKRIPGLLPKKARRTKLRGDAKEALIDRYSAIAYDVKRLGTHDCLPM